MTRYQIGQALIEVTIAVAVVIILVTSLVAVTTFSLKTSRMGQMRSRAVKSAEEGLELVRQKKNAGWTAFRALDGAWCLDQEGVWTAAEEFCPITDVKGFQRTVDLTWNEVSSRMDVTVTAGWYEGDDYFQSRLDSFFTEWK